MSNGDTPSRPVNTEEYHSEGGHSIDSFGLTKREEIAKHLMSGLLASTASSPVELFAKNAVEAADALLLALEK